jgi:hypothetical protein
MRSRRVYGALCAALFAVGCVAVLPGCGSGGEQIPLANVPPPPPGFGQVQARSKVPKTASPQNANDIRR